MSLEMRLEHQMQSGGGTCLRWAGNDANTDRALIEVISDARDKQWHYPCGRIACDASDRDSRGEAAKPAGLDRVANVRAVLPVTVQVEAGGQAVVAPDVEARVRVVESSMLVNADRVKTDSLGLNRRHDEKNREEDGFHVDLHAANLTHTP